MTKQEKINLIQVILAIIITCIVMFIFVGQKQGWHEDEIFSYGSSNYKYDNLFQIYDYKDSLNQLIDEKVMDKSPVKTVSNIWYYLTHSDEFFQEYHNKQQEEHSIWKIPEDALDYISVSTGEALSYWSVYYNQSRDVHPPLFYFLVHFVSSLCLNHFSKYIIFSINLVFYILTCLMIRKIMKLFGKDNLSGITILLYGLSMGAISIVMFQRMYVMLGFFTLTYLYLNLKIVKNDYQISKKDKKWLTVTILLGFLTQYYFCIYVVILAVVMMLIMLRKKQYDSFKRYLWCHVKGALIGIIIFPASIYHIFFSYRGLEGGVVEASYLSRLKEYLEIVFYAFSVPKNLGYICVIILAILLVLKLFVAKRKDIIAIICFPIILFFLVVVKIAPFINIRYISIIFPMVVIAVVLMILGIVRHIYAYVAKKKKTNIFFEKYAGLIIVAVLTIGISTYGLKTSEPQFLYKEYAKRIELAEEYHDLRMVYVGESTFGHLKDMEEFLRYRSSFIVNTWNIDDLKDNEELKSEKEFILNIKCWISDFDENLEKVLKYTDAKECELLLDDGESRMYKITK